MIKRYTLPKMGDLWSEQNKYQKWLDVELAICEGLAAVGEIPQDALKTINSKACFDIRRIEEIEATTKHDIIAFVSAVAENVGEAGRYIHLGVTSSDVLDTALAILLRDAASIIISDLESLLTTIKDRASEFKNTIMIGRSHGMHAEPVTFGLKLAIWYDEMGRHMARVKRAKEVISYGKISGAVGTFANVDPKVEAIALAKLGLKPAPASSQIIARDRHAEYFCALAQLASSIDKIAVELRHLQRTEIAEVEEEFTKGQKGSSAMPHKKNPISAENLSGLSRLVRSYAFAALENVPLWHERDISHSSVERVIGPDATILTDYMLNRLDKLIKGLGVDAQRMKENLELTKGAIYSQGLLLSLARKGLSREDAYKLVQQASHHALQTDKDLKDVVLADKALARYFDNKEIEEIFNPARHTKYVDEIFRRVFG